MIAQLNRNIKNHVQLKINLDYKTRLFYRIMYSPSVDDFIMLTQIGKGTYAKVILVRHKTDNKLYALKMLKKRYIIQKNQQQHIMTEKAILAKIDHPFLIKLHWSFQDQKKLYFVLQYCPGGQLFNLLAIKDKLSEDQAKFYSAQIVLALEQLHKHKIIYRDLKPENIIIDKDGNIKLTDFGLSKILNSQNSVAMSICGTPQYLAPEIIKKMGHGVDVDWWCLGCLIHQMVTGFPPYHNENRMQLFQSIVYKNIDLSKFTPKLQDLFKKLLHKDFKKRLGHNGSEEIKKHPWFERINWEALRAKKVKAPFIPKLANETDTNNFDAQFTAGSIGSFEEQHQPQLDDDEKFKDFSYGHDQQN